MKVVEKMHLFKKMRLCIMPVLVVLVAAAFKAGAVADGVGDIFGTESVGASLVFDTDAYYAGNTEVIGIPKRTEIEKTETNDLVMANVSSVLNVRAEGNLDAEVVGKIYKDCGGKVLERGEEWSLIKTGDLIGWASNEYLLFDEEAEKLAKKVGIMIATVESDCVALRDEASLESAFSVMLADHALVEVVEEVDENWLLVAYGTYEGYVEREFMKVDFQIDCGETMEVINERKRKEQEAKERLIRQREAMQTDENTLRLLAALIYCEAGGESYEGKLAVGAVVMNRVRSGGYPDTVYDVIFASGQFSPAMSGWLTRIFNQGPNAVCVQAAQEALNGYTNVGDMTHFRRKGTKEGYIIGNHVFY